MPPGFNITRVRSVDESPPLIIMMRCVFFTSGTLLAKYNELYFDYRLKGSVVFLSIV